MASHTSRPATNDKKKAAKKPSALATTQGTRVLATAAKSHARDLVTMVQRKKLEVAEAFYDVGRALGELLRKKLYASLGYATFREMLDREDLFGVSQARKLIAVAKAYKSRENALRAGPEKGFAIVRYSAATKSPDPPDAIVEAGFPVGNARRPVEEVTLRQILHATRGALLRQTGRKGAAARERREVEDAVDELLRRQKKRAPHLKVHVIGRKGVYRVVLDVPFDEVKGFLRG